MNIGVAAALASLRPEASWTCGETYESIVWHSDPATKPSEAEVVAEIAVLQQQYTNNEYQRLRAAEYPPLEEQFDVLYHQGYDGWKAVIQAVKNKYPKPV